MAANKRQREPKTPSIDWAAELAAHRRWLRTVILARTGERAAVDEVMQEVAGAALDGASAVIDPSKTAAWLYGVAVRQSLLYRRRLGRQRRFRRHLHDQATMGSEENREPDPLDWLLADERRRLVRTALSQLTGRDAEILLLKYTENFSYRQLADYLGISENAVESRLHRARSRLRHELVLRNVVEVRS